MKNEEFNSNYKKASPLGRFGGAFNYSYISSSTILDEIEKVNGFSNV